MAAHSSVLAWRIPGTGEPGGLPSMGLHRVGHYWSDLTAAAAAAGKTSRPFRYGLNQIPYILEVTNKFKGLDLLDRVPEELWTEVCNIVHKAVTQIIPNRKKWKKAKWLSEEALQTAEKWSEKQQWKGKYTQLNAEFQRITKTQEGPLQWTMQRNRGKQQMGKD